MLIKKDKSKLGPLTSTWLWLGQLWCALVWIAGFCIVHILVCRVPGLLLYA